MTFVIHIPLWLLHDAIGFICGVVFGILLVWLAIRKATGEAIGRGLGW